MGFFDFVKEAGQKLFHSKEAEAAQSTVAQTPEDAEASAKVEALNRAAGDAIETYVNEQGLKVTGLAVTFDAATGVATAFGVAADQATKEKALLCCGNVEGVGQVEDKMTVDQSAPEANFYTVVKGDNLSKIAKQFYDNPNKYPVIFEANKPMLSHPDKIYPGQVLRIPPL